MNPNPARRPNARATARSFSALAAALALALASMLCLPACSAETGGTPEPGETSRYEKAVELPAGILHVDDIAFSGDGSLVMAATTSGSLGKTVYRETAEGFWEPLFDTQALLASLGDGAAVGASCLTPDGRLFCNVSDAEAGIDACYLVDPASFLEVPLGASSIMKMRCFDEETALVYDWTKTFARYDLSTGKKLCEYRLPGTAVLADFTVHDGRVFATVSQSSGSSSSNSYEVFNADTGEKEAVDPSLQSTLDALFSSADSPDAPAPVWACNDEGLYVCAENALYSCAADTATIIASGEGTNLSNSGKRPERLVVGERPDDIAVLYLAPSASSQNTLYRYVEGEQPEPTSSLTVYMLEDNAAIQQAVATYRDKHPETAIEVQVGIPVNSGLSADDALRALNAEVLSGTGPDVIALDGLPIADFIEQGVLLDLSDIVQASLDGEDAYFESVLGAFSTDQGCYAIPSRFGVPAIFGDADMVEHATSLGELTSFVESCDETKAALGAGVSVPALYAASYRNIFGDGTGVNREALGEFFACTKTLLAIGGKPLIENAPEGYDYLGSRLNGIARDPYGISGTSMLGANDNPVRLEIGTLLSGNNFGMTSLATENVSFDCVLEPLDLGSGPVFVPSGILSVNASSPHADVAKEFISYLISKEHQKQQGLDEGLPVNKSAFTEQMLELGGYSVGFMGDVPGSEQSTFDRGPFTEAEVAANCALVETATLCCAPDKTVSDIVEVELTAYCRDAVTLDQAVESAMQKINLYLAQ